MTDQEINRAVAEARGWEETNMGGAGMAWKLPNGAIRALPDVINDPTAWGAFFQELIADGWSIEMKNSTQWTQVKLVRWIAGPTKEAGEGLDSFPGRALALAFLKAKGKHNAV